MDSHVSSKVSKQSKKDAEMGPGVDPIPTPKHPLSPTAKLEDVVDVLMNGDADSREQDKSLEEH
ncbi:hypothetical protein [Paenibacillus brevis]|uniref:Uncharacterized protein n=1 Tax=Paenibacillus brevis TaxID=2841508 RepID=A0ABS6FWU2_9BACL|nr:hypothetical protein [Paenibacillus brevis]MBU5674697.1 hypothetical protein [Paenibacillus brevis]